jgi:SIR2-like domain
MYVKKFCSSALYQEHETLYRKLAEIPVSLYVSIAPDDFLARALGTQAQYTYYGDKNVKVREVEATPENPLLYQLFGSIKNTSSLVCSHDGLYDLLKAILENKQLPAALEQFFQESAMGHVLFLGFDFKQWYVQLILRILNLTKPTNGLNRTATQQQIVAESTEIAEQHFQINFIDKDCAEFVNILHQKCKDAGLLRTITSNGETVAKISEEAKKQRIGDIKTQFMTLIKLKGEWEQEKMFATGNPTKEMQCEVEVEKVTNEIQKLQQELQTLTN